ncbi:MAG: hypothetical protein HWN66_19855 [Candidatus Helarchaeota archaeon]|nr:hypothetical protein [Candidatus Helarchaeota archaeon]
MPQKELEIPSKVRSYQGYPEVIEFEGCPRCNSLDVNPKIVSFKKNDIRFEITCMKCGLLYDAYENINSNTELKTIMIEWDF